MDPWLGLLIGLILTVGTGLFVASEFALVNLDRADLEVRQERGESRLAMTIAALRTTSTHLSAAQLGITLTTLLAGYTLEPALTTFTQPLLSFLPEAAQRPTAMVVAVSLATVVSMILGELVPKNFALALPRQTAKLVIPFQTAFTNVFRPIIKVLNGSANAVLRALGVEPKEELSSARTADELSSLVRRSASEGLLEEDTAGLLDRSLNFASLTAADAMTARPSMHAVAADEPVDEIIRLAQRTGHSRFPVYQESLDDIMGIAHLKSAVAVPSDRRSEVPVGAIATDVLRVPETQHLDQLVSELRQNGYQVAIVVDEYGGTAGLVTMEDLVEEIVGEVSDEHDRRRAGVVRGAADAVTFPAELRPDEVLAQGGVVVPNDDVYDTVGGYIMSVLERIPTVGDTVAVPDGILEVIRMDGRRVDRVKFVPHETPADESEVNQ